MKCEDDIAACALSRFCNCLYHFLRRTQAVARSFTLGFSLKASLPEQFAPPRTLSQPTDAII